MYCMALVLPPPAKAIRYDTIQYDAVYLRAPKSRRIASLICRTEPNKKSRPNEETKNENRHAQKKRSSHKVRGVSPEAGRESMAGKICERGIDLEPGVKERGSYGLDLVRVVS